MKRTLTAILIIIILYNSAGFILSFYSLQRAIKIDVRESIKQQIPLSQLELIKIPIKLLDKQIEKSDENEFKLNGKMYDVAKEIQKNDTIYFYCFNDKNEEKLFEKFSNDVSGNLGTEGIFKTKMLKNLKIFSFDAINLITKPKPDIFYEMAFNLYLSQRYNSFHPDINPPPPKTVVNC
ncbi:MAG: hypothetical protein ABSG15_08945 [FCB group bacterium]|jgi:hypothetical protein